MPRPKTFLLPHGGSYSVVYHIEIALLFSALVAVGPLASRRTRARRRTGPSRFGLAELPG